MKKLFSIILLAGLMLSCDNDKFKVENPLQETTVEMQRALAADTTSALYKVYTLDLSEETIYLVNSETNLVEYKVRNYSGALGTTMLVAIGAFFVGLIVGAVSMD